MLKYRLAFASIRGMGVDLATRLLEVVGSEEEFFSLSETQLRQLTGSRSRIYSKKYRQDQLAQAERELDFLSRSNIKTLYYTDAAYPQRLLHAPDAPCLLFTTGTCDLNAAHVVSVVGTRHATPYGTSWTADFVDRLSRRLPDTIVVSGLAYGIDISAHRACLRSGLPTVAVMARGLNAIYPAHHRNDAAAIVRSGGLCLTEYRSFDSIHRSNFLARNRIIAGMADCTVVVESASTGGALVTASLAASYNRDVMAVPGRVGDEFSKGCNKLICSNRALAITCADDLLKAMRWDEHAIDEAAQLEIFPELTSEQQTVVDLLKSGGDMHINSIAEQAGMPVYRVMAALVELDCKGLVLTLPGSRYAIRK